MQIRVRLYPRNKIWYIRYSYNGKYRWKSTGTTDRKIAEILKSEFENKLIKSQLTGQPIEQLESPSIFQFFRLQHFNCLVPTDDP